MSYQNYKEAMESAPKCKFYTTVGGKSQEEISKSEEMLGVKFSKQCREFYEQYGYLSFFGNEIFGIDPDDDSGELEGNSVAYALNDREEYGLPVEWIPVYNFDDGFMAYLDYSSLNDDGEPCVIVAGYNGSEYQVEETIAEDFGEFVLRLVKQQLEFERSTLYMKKKTTYFVCIGIAVLLLICTILYFKPLSLSNIADKDMKMYITLIEYSIENGEQISATTEYQNITEEQHKEILSVLDEYTYQRTFETLFSNGTMHGLGNKVLYIGNGKIITVTATGKLAINGKIYSIDNAEQLIQQILEIVE